MPKIKCLLVDDHTLFRQGVRRLLESESDFEVVGEAADGGDAVEKARELRPDIVLMDIGMPGLSSFESSRQIKKNRAETKILFLTMYDDEDYLVQCLEAGASGYVLKDTPAPQLLNAVRDVYRGGKYLSSQVLGKLVEDFRARLHAGVAHPRTKIFHQLSQHLRAQVLSAAIDIAHRAHQLRRRRVLQHIPGRAHFQALQQVVFVLIHGQIEDLGLRAVLLDVPRGLERRQPGHADVHQHHVGAQIARLLHRVTRVGRLAYHFEIALALQQTAHSLPEQRMIVNQ